MTKEKLEHYQTLLTTLEAVQKEIKVVQLIIDNCKSKKTSVINEIQIADRTYNVTLYDVNIILSTLNNLLSLLQAKEAKAKQEFDEA